MQNPVLHPLQIFTIIHDNKEVYCSYYKTYTENIWTINLPREVIELSLDVDTKGKTLWLLNGCSNNVSKVLGKAIEDSHRRLY